MPIYTYTTLDDPLAGALGTTAQGINAAGQIVGIYDDAAFNGHGFLLSGGTYTTLDDPLAASSTFAQGINATGQIVGFYLNNLSVHGFFDSGGLYAPVDDPLSTNGPATFAYGINATGQIVGYYSAINPNTFAVTSHGFLFTNGLYAPIDDPLAGASGTVATGINAVGQIIGYYYDNRFIQHGFLHNPNDGSYTTLDDPLATSGTVASGINDMGQIVGTYFNASGSHGFHCKRHQRSGPDRRLFL